MVWSKIELNSNVRDPPLCIYVLHDLHFDPMEEIYYSEDRWNLHMSHKHRYENEHDQDNLLEHMDEDNES